MLYQSIEKEAQAPDQSIIYFFFISCKVHMAMHAGEQRAI